MLRRRRRQFLRRLGRARSQAARRKICRVHRGADTSPRPAFESHAEYLQPRANAMPQYGTLFVLDEVQTGMYRTGPFLAAHHFGVEPDMVILAKALSGGLIPVGAVLMTDDDLQLDLQLAEALDRSHVDLQRECARDARRAGHARRAAKRSTSASARRSWENLLRSRLDDALRLRDDQRGPRHGHAERDRVPRRRLSSRLRLSFEAFRAIHPGHVRPSAGDATVPRTRFSPRSAATTSWC